MLGKSCREPLTAWRIASAVAVHVYRLPVILNLQIRASSKEQES
jgi:hypothetical protein